MKSWTPKLLGGKFTKLARAFSKNYKVNVTLGGLKACTDGNTISIPANADYLKDADQQVLEGILDHEWSHVAEEQEAKENGTKSPMDFMRATDNKTERLMLNVFEDIRIEMKQGAKYPGVRENLQANNRNAVKLYLKESTVAKADFWQLLGAAIIFKARDMEIEAWASPELIHLVDVVLADEMAESLKQTGVADAWSLALRTIEKVKDLKEEIEETRESGDMGDDGDQDADGEQGEDAEKGEGQEGVDEGGGDQDGDGDQGESGADKEQGEEQGESEGQSDGQGDVGDEEGDSSDGGSGSDGGNEGDGDGDQDADGDEQDGDGDESPAKVKRAMVDDVHKMLEGSGKEAAVEDMLDYNKDQIAAAAESDAAAHGRYIPHPDAVKLDRWTRPAISERDKETYVTRKMAASKSISALRSKLLSVLRISTQSYWAGDQEQGVLDSASLFSLRTGNRRVFATHHEGQSLDTAVSILVDQSGSMGRAGSESSRSYYAQLAAISLCETLDALNIPFEMIGFDNDWDERTSRLMSSGTHPKGQRIEPLHMREYKSFNEPYKARRASLVHITGNGDNTDGEAVLKTAERLAQRKEARRILIVLSDGYPAAHGDPNLFNNHLKVAVKMVTQAGIDVLGLGIQSDSVKTFYNKSTGAEWDVVNDLEELAPAIMRMFRKKMVNKSGARRAA